MQSKESSKRLKVVSLFSHTQAKSNSQLLPQQWKVVENINEPL